MTNKLLDLMRALAKRKIFTTMHYHEELDIFYLDLETRTKSELCLREDGSLRGRYSYENQIDLSKDIDELINELCGEVNKARHGRPYCQAGWAELIASRGYSL